MKRETRNNLIFLAILIPLVLPAGIMLFIAKLDPEAKQMFQPDKFRGDAVYINYDDQRPTGKRLVPDMTSQWIQDEAYGLFHPAIRQYIKLHAGLASLEHRFEVVGIATSEESGTFMVVVVWDPYMKSPVFTLADDQMAEVSQFTRDVPPGVRRELQEDGFVKPPATVRAYLLQSTEPALGQDLVVSYTSMSGESRTDSLLIPNQEQMEIHDERLPPAQIHSVQEKNTGTVIPTTR